MLTNPRIIFIFIAVFSAMKDSRLHCLGFLRQAGLTTSVWAEENPLSNVKQRIKPGSENKRARAQNAALTITRTEFSFESCFVLGAQSLNEEPGFLQECTRSRGRLTMQGLRTCCCEVPGVPPAARAAPQLWGRWGCPGSSPAPWCFSFGTSLFQLPYRTCSEQMISTLMPGE